MLTHLHRRCLSFIGITALITTVAACDAADDYQDLDQLSGALTAGKPAPSDVHIKGVKYRWQRKNPKGTASEPVDERFAKDEPSPDKKHPSEKDRPVYSTAEELADQLRPVVVFETGDVYLADPDLEGAKAIFLKGKAVTSNGSGDSPPVPLEILMGDTTSLQGISGTDNRTAPPLSEVWNNRLLRSQLQIGMVTPVTNVFNRCTASAVGPRTALTAAHCLRNPDESYDRAFLYGNAGAVNNQPFWHFNCIHYFAYPYGWSHYGWTDNHFFWDIGLISFGQCWDNPAQRTGWQNFQMDALPNLPNGSPMVNFGYPGSLCSGAVQYPSLCGMAAYAKKECVPARGSNCFAMSSKDLDGTKGQSGSGWYVPYAGEFRLAGVFSRHSPSGPCYLGFIGCFPAVNVATYIGSEINSWIYSVFE